MANVLILGAGLIGSAFSVVCLENKHKVKIIGTHLEDILIDELKKNNNFHPALKIHLDKETNIIKYRNFSKELINMPDLIVLAVSSKGIKWTADQLSNVFDGQNLPPILMLTKGLGVYNNLYELLVNQLERLLTNKGFRDINISAVGGPCIANCLANKLHTSVVIANKKIATVKWLREILSNDYYHVAISDDIVGVQVCAAIKNIFSMVIGASKGLYNNKNLKNENNHLNAEAALFKQSVYEMEIFVDLLGGHKKTVYGLAGLGDLYVSAMGGRNSKMGSYIGEGFNYSEAKKVKMPHQTVEGADLIFEIGSKIRKDFNINKMPLMVAMTEAIIDDKKLIINWKDF